MKKLQSVKLSDSELLTANQMSSIIGGWTTHRANTYIGAQGDCQSSCDQSHPDQPCLEGDSQLDWHWCPS